MINVKILSTMEMAKILGGREKEVRLPEGACISDLLYELKKEYGESIEKVIYSSNRNLELTILLNGRSIAFLEGLKTKIKDGDNLFFLPPVIGG